MTSHTGTCFGPTAAHDGQHPRRYVIPPLPAATTLCDGCVERLRSMGMDWQPIGEDSRESYDDELSAWRERVAG